MSATCPSAAWPAGAFSPSAMSAAGFSATGTASAAPVCGLGDDVRHEKHQHRGAGERQPAGRQVRFQQGAADHRRIDQHAKQKEQADNEEPNVAALHELPAAGGAFGDRLDRFAGLRGLLGARRSTRRRPATRPAARVPRAGPPPPWPADAPSGPAAIHRGPPAANRGRRISGRSGPGSARSRSGGT